MTALRSITLTPDHPSLRPFMLLPPLKPNVLAALALGLSLIPATAQDTVIPPDWSVGLQELDLSLMDQG